MNGPLISEVASATDLQFPVLVIVIGAVLGTGGIAGMLMGEKGHPLASAAMLIAGALVGACAFGVVAAVFMDLEENDARVAYLEDEYQVQLAAIPHETGISRTLKIPGEPNTSTPATVTDGNKELDCVIRTDDERYRIFCYEGGDSVALAPRS